MYCPNCGATIEDSYKFCKSCGIALTGQESSGNIANTQGIWVAGTKDEAESYCKAAEQGDAKAQYKLGLCYVLGEGVAKDKVEAVKWFRKAAEQWDADAQYALVFCYDSIESGVKQDKAEAVKWYRQAAEQGNAKAQHQLGLCYYNGSGVAEDRVVAAKWLCKAAEQGDAEAQYSFGYFCENGLGVVQDKVEAVKWYRKAAEQGNEQAQKRLELITCIPSDAKAAPVEVEPEKSICPVCNCAITRENSLDCPACGVKYHQECWKMSRGGQNGPLVGGLKRAKKNHYCFSKQPT